MRVSGGHAAAGVGNVITVEGALHAPDVADLRAVVVAALAQADHVELDLRGVDFMSPEAVRALADCARIGTGVVLRFGRARPTHERCTPR
jgi:hypothetical protein